MKNEAVISSWNSDHQGWNYFYAEKTDIKLIKNLKYTPQRPRCIKKGKERPFVNFKFTRNRGLTMSNILNLTQQSGLSSYIGQTWFTLSSKAILAQCQRTVKSTQDQVQKL